MESVILPVVVLFVDFVLNVSRGVPTQSNMAKDHLDFV